MLSGCCKERGVSSRRLLHSPTSVCDRSLPVKIPLRHYSSLENRALRHYSPTFALKSGRPHALARILILIVVALSNMSLTLTTLTLTPESKLRHGRRRLNVREHLIPRDPSAPTTSPHSRNCTCRTREIVLPSNHTIYCWCTCDVHVHLVSIIHLPQKGPHHKEPEDLTLYPPSRFPGLHRCPAAAAWPRCLPALVRAHEDLPEPDRPLDRPADRRSPW